MKTTVEQLHIKCCFYLLDAVEIPYYEHSLQVELSELLTEGRQWEKPFSRSRFGSLTIGYADQQFVSRYEGIWYLRHLFSFTPELIEKGERRLYSELNDGYDLVLTLLPNQMLRIRYVGHNERNNDPQLITQDITVPQALFFKQLADTYFLYIQVRRNFEELQLSAWEEEQLPLQIDSFKLSLSSIGATW